MATYRIAIIGCGRVAAHHLRAWEQTPGAEVVALCDLDTARAAGLAEGRDLPIYANYHEMLSTHADADIVCIVTPSGMHPEHAADVVGRYARHAIIEKPFVMTPDQGRTLMDLAASTDRRVFPVFQNRYNPAVRRLKSAVERGELGRLALCTVRLRWCRPQRYYDLSPWRGTYSHDGGALTNQGIHYLDLLRYLGGDIKRVHALLRTQSADIEVEDTAVALAEFSNGASGNIEITTAARPDDLEASISIFGSKGHAVLGGLATNQLLAFSPDPSATAAYSQEIPDAYGFGHIAMFREVVRALAGETADIVTDSDGLETIRLLHALYQSDEEDRWVSLADRTLRSVRLGRPGPDISALYHSPPAPTQAPS